jgi:hypothetical protein
MDLDTMRQCGSPSPQDEIGHVRLGANRKGRYEHASTSLHNEAVCNTPGRRISPVRNIVRPGATQGSQGDTARLPTVVVPEVDHVIYIDFVRADGERIESMRKPMRHLSEHSVNSQGQIEGRHAFGIEAAAMRPGAVTRKR